jgi:Arc/MetJ-type ribon-helix-helix transcriptional regulator
MIITFRAPEKTLEVLDSLIEAGYGKDRSDVIRKALSQVARAIGVMGE